MQERRILLNRMPEDGELSPTSLHNHRLTQLPSRSFTQFTSSCVKRIPQVSSSLLSPRTSVIFCSKLAQRHMTMYVAFVPAFPRRRRRERLSSNMSILWVYSTVPSSEYCLRRPMFSQLISLWLGSTSTRSRQEEDCFLNLDCLLVSFSHAQRSSPKDYARTD